MESLATHQKKNSRPFFGEAHTRYTVDRCSKTYLLWILINNKLTVPFPSKLFQLQATRMRRCNVDSQWLVTVGDQQQVCESWPTVSNLWVVFKCLGRERFSINHENVSQIAEKMLTLVLTLQIAAMKLTKLNISYRAPVCTRKILCCVLISESHFQGENSQTCGKGSRAGCHISNNIPVIFQR